MRFTKIVSTAAVAISILASGGAYAATLVGGVTVTDLDLPKVQELCTQMVGEPHDALGATSNSMMDSKSTDGATNAEDKTIDDINVQDCIDAGLLPADTVVNDIKVTN